MTEPKILNNNQLLKVINKLREISSTSEMQFLSRSNNVEYRKRLTNEFPDFSMDYPALFNMIIDNPINFDMRRLTQMLSMRKKVENKEISYEEASTQIGQQYYDEFAKPLVDKITKN